MTLDVRVYAGQSPGPKGWTERDRNAVACYLTACEENPGYMFKSEWLCNLLAQHRVDCINAALQITPEKIENAARAAHLADEPEGAQLSLHWDDLLPDTRERYKAYAEAILKELVKQ